MLGGSGLHPRIGPGALEIGYWMRADAVGQGYATESTAALTRVAFEVADVERVEIHCSTENHASAAIPRKLGYSLREAGDDLIFTLTADDFPGSPSAGGAARRLRRDRSAPHRRPRVKHWHQAPVFQGQ